MGPHGSQSFKTLPLQILTESFQTPPQFSSQRSSQNYIWDFWNFENWNLNDFFLFSLTWDPIGANNSKRHSFCKLQPKRLKLVLIFPPIGPRKVTFVICKIWSFQFLAFFFESLQFTIAAYGKSKTSIIWKTSDHRAKLSEIWDSLVPVIHTYMYRWRCNVQGHFGIIRCTCDFSWLGRNGKTGENISRGYRS